MEQIVTKSNGFFKIMPIYLGLGIIATLVAATLLLLKKFEIWVYVILSVGGFSLLAALFVFVLNRRLPACYISREGNKLVFENGFICKLCEVDNVFYVVKNSTFIVVVGENKFCYRFVSNPAAARERLLALVEESKKENPDYNNKQ